MRTIIDLPDEQIQALDRWCRRDGISRAEAVRRAVAQTVASQGTADAEKAFGLWRERPVDGRAYQQRIRREWDQPSVKGAHRSR